MSVALFMGYTHLYSQSYCKIQLKGQVVDISTLKPLQNAHITIRELKTVAFSDSSGLFIIRDLCPGKYHIVITHIGCESFRIYLEINKDTTLNIFMDHHSHPLEGVTISGSGSRRIHKSNSIQSARIDENAHLNLGNILENIAGVYAMRTGYNISKPIVHGLYGNRLMILNNGLTQSGQQWGNDHSPEIDPLSSDKITVIKGTSVIQYQGSSLGSIISVEPGIIGTDPHLHGKAGYYFESNGQSHGIHSQLYKYNEENISWRFSTTLRKSGDRKTPDYFLRNTGREEANLSFTMEKKHREGWKSSLYLSSFNTKIGILRGAHIGNLTDLSEAMSRKVPFFTQENFSYDLASPYQSVGHHLLKLNSKYFINEHKWVEFTLGSQLNNRNEFDIRRGVNSQRASLSLTQFTQFAEGKYTLEFAEGYLLFTGVQSNFILNINNPGTGVLPLIPDYTSSENGIFFMTTGTVGIVDIEAGVRYDFIWQNATKLSSGLPRTEIQFSDVFHNLNASTGASIRLSSNNKVSWNLGYNTRNPGINERFSGGLHQGVSGIEEGDPDLISEKAIKTTAGWEGNIKKRFFFDLLTYYQWVSDYIYLNPENEFRLTIRGAFPVFRYKQTNAALFGIDFGGNAEITDHLHVSVKYSYIKGRDLSNNLPLVFMAPAQIQSGIKLLFNNFAGFSNPQLEVNFRHVSEQNYFEVSQDFLPPPPAYSLVGIRLSAVKEFKNLKLNFYTSADNIFNIQYRDFLNRQRYFADELGRNITFGVNVNF
jgi:iron complex outermembrane recepter protein